MTIASPLPSVSVAMCTYNGERYVSQQLRSILKQTCAPAEICVFDDASTDQTVDVVRSCQSDACVPIRISKRETNVGWVQNSSDAVSACTSELVALSDQDDVWLLGRLAQQARLLHEHPHLGAVAGNAWIVKGDLSPTHTLNLGATDLRIVHAMGSFSALLRANWAQGATFVFRREFRDAALPVPAGWSFDAWFAIVIGALSDVHLIDEPLMLYRQHEKNLLGRVDMGLFNVRALYSRVKGKSRAHLEHEVKKFSDLRDRLVALNAGETKRRLVEQKIRHLEARLKVATKQPVGAWALVREISSTRYHRYSRGWRSVARDLIA